MNGRTPALVAVALLMAMAAGAAVLSTDSSSPAPPGPPSSTTSSTAYPADPADRRPVVPWLATRAPPFPGPPAQVPPCEASQLRVVRTYAEGATGHAADFIEVSNATATPCSVSARPVVELRDVRGRLIARSGDREPFIPSGSGVNATPEPWMVPPLSAPPTTGVEDRSPHEGLPFFTPAQAPCPGGVFPVGSMLYLVVGGGRVPITSMELPLAFDYRCDEPPEAYPPPSRPELLAGNFHAEPVAWFVEHPAVSIEIEAPARVVTGSTLRYRVRTRVARHLNLKLYGCPGYTQRLGDRHDRRLLNCAALEDSLGRPLFVDQRFDLVFAVPKDTRPGRSTLSWELDPPFQRARASAPIDVVRR